MAGTAIISDDDGFFRMALATILRTRLGFGTVHETGSLDEALDVLAENPGVTLALFDLDMPGMAGAASLSAVRELFPDVTTAVVSGSTRRDDILGALTAGVHGFVPKGTGVDELTRALSMVIEGWVYVPRSVTEVAAAGDEDAPPAPVPAPPSIPYPVLTLRQSQALSLIVEGRSNKEIARSLGLGEGTVKIHVAALLRALGVQNRSAAAALGARMRGVAA